MKTWGSLSHNSCRVSIALLLGAAIALAQDGPPGPTGIQLTGAISLTRAESIIPAFLPGAAPSPSVSEFFVAGFRSTDYTNYTPPPPPDPTKLQTIGPCIVSIVDLTQVLTPNGIVTTPLDAGPVVNLNGPNGPKQFAVTKGSYGGSLSTGISIPIPGLAPPGPPYIVPGTYTVDNGAGGADIGPFTASLTVPDPLFEWTNPDANLTITRSAGVDITFTGGDPNGMVTIQGTVSLFTPGTFTIAGGGSFSCIVPNTGEFFVTPDVLNLLPATVPVPNIPSSSLTVTQGTQATFDAPIATYSGFFFSTGTVAT